MNYEFNGIYRPGAGTVDGWAAPALREDEAAVSQNMKPMNGKWVKRGGTVSTGAGTTSATVRGLFHAYGTDATAALVVRIKVVGTILEYKVGSGAWTSFKTGLTAGTFWVGAFYKGHLYMCDGVNTPQDITIANPPTITNWVTLPSGINPSWVILHYNRLRYGGDLTTPNYYYMTNVGDPNTTTTTDFYLQPDDQNGNYPKMAVLNNNRVGLFCQDFLVSQSGAGPFTDQFYPLPRGAANVAWRTIVDMGEFGAFYMTERGVFQWDLQGPPVPIDPFGRINWSNFDLTTETTTWAVRVGDEYRIYFKSKGDVTRTSASASAILASSTSFTLISALYAARTALTTRAFTTSTTTDSYYSYDCRLRQFSGPHTGGHLCGAWQQYRYGDTQQLWVGSAAADGKVWMADQQSAYYDDGTVAIECLLRTGAIGDRRRKTKILRITSEFGVVDATAQSAVKVSVFQNGRQSATSEAVASYPVSISRRSNLGEDNPLNDLEDCEDFVVHEGIPEYEGRIGMQPQVEFSYTGQSPFEIRSYSIDFEGEQ